MEPNDEEVVMCARYGEHDDLKLLLEAKSNVNHKDYNGSSALHMACGNGHLDIVKLLCEHNAEYTANNSGNFPLHWAALNKHVPVVEYLVTNPKYEKDIDVFQANEFGKSPVAHAFDNQCSEIVVHLLKHKSAAKAENSTTVESEDSEYRPPADLVEKVHDLDLSPPGGAPAPVVKVREVSSLAMQWGGKAFDKHAEEDQTGTQVWAASILLARRIVELKDMFKGKRVIELGSGCGLPGLAARACTDAKDVLLTDLFPLTLHNLKFNVSLNFNKDHDKVALPAALSSDEPLADAATTDTGDSNSKQESDEKEEADEGKDISEGLSELTLDEAARSCDGVGVQAVDWDVKSSWPKDKADIIIASDVVYKKEMVANLVAILKGLLVDEGVVLLTARGDQRDGMPEFKAAMKKAGFQMDMQTCAKQYYENPLVNKDDKECADFFVLDPSHEYHFYRFDKLPAKAAAPKKKKKRRKKKPASKKPAGAKKPPATNA